MVRDQDGRPAFYEVDPSFEYPHEIEPGGRPRHYRSGFGVNGNETTACRVVFGLDPEESLFGLGEKFTSIDKRGQRIVVWNHAAQGTSTELAYKNIPFMVSSRGYGLLLNDSGRSIWSLGSASNAAGTVEVEGPGLDLFIIIDSNMKGVLDGYADLTGHAPLPPRWSFGSWMSPLGEHVMGAPVHQESLLALADELRHPQSSQQYRG